MINETETKGEQLERMFNEKTGQKFDVVYNKFRVKLVWFLWNMSKDEVLAEEVADEAFVDALMKIEQYNNEKGFFSTWLFSIARNLMLSKLNAKKKFSSLEEDHDGATIGDFLYAEDYTGEIKEETITEKKAKLIIKEISLLPQKYAIIITMVDLDGMSYQDIADYLELNINTVKSRIKKGRELLVDKVKDTFKEIDKQML
jgi:RNA polymerase sigma-70 factor (ECF subfamily)